MKLKVTIDLDSLIEDLFVDCDPEYGPEYELKELVKLEIMQNAKSAILKEIKDPMKKDLESRIKILVEDSYKSEISSEIKSLLKDKKIRGKYSGDPELTLKAWISTKLNDYISKDNTIEKIIKTQAESLSQDLKNRYDMYFASQFLIKLRDQGVLKEGVLDSLKLTDESV